jgi:cellulose synthase/poly-beta-1,6-N-acetylglucosamine synthase-like glycosyltransferase
MHDMHVPAIIIFIHNGAPQALVGCLELGMSSSVKGSDGGLVRPVELELTILMPCLNEAETLGACIAKAQAFLVRKGVAGEVVVADNGSTDESREIARQRGARVVNVPTRGYGAALLGGIEAARGRYIHGRRRR